MIVTFGPAAALAAGGAVGTLAAGAAGVAACGAGTSLPGTGTDAASPGTAGGCDFVTAAGGGACSCCHAVHRKNAEEKKIA